jgi:uncharacterized membrane protein
MHNTENQTDRLPTSSGMDPKVVAIISYITLIGWIVAVVMNNPKTSLASFHIRQSLGLMAISVALSIIAVVPILGWIAFVVGWIGLIILWLVGFLSALQEEEKLVPIVGEYFQEWFKAL